MVTIQNLEVQFDVEGSDEEQMFLEMFNRYIDEWNRRREDQAQVRKAMMRDRGLGDRIDGE
ncbi:MAG: hypothetical protein QNJ40_06035 [Xanthomonadales bacterium]|nr:hypothetical protein [Xanthomonadales bacterium]